VAATSKFHIHTHVRLDAQHVMDIICFDGVYARQRWQCGQLTFDGTSFKFGIRADYSLFSKLPPNIDTDTDTETKTDTDTVNNVDSPQKVVTKS